MFLDIGVVKVDNSMTGLRVVAEVPGHEPLVGVGLATLIYTLGGQDGVCIVGGRRCNKQTKYKFNTVRNRPYLN